MVSRVDSFNHWIDNSKSEGHLTDKNATKLKKAFGKTVQKYNDPEKALTEFGSTVDQMKKEFPGKGRSCYYIKNAAESILAPKADHDAMAWAKEYEKNKNDVSAQKSMLVNVFKQTKKATKKAFWADGKKITISPNSLQKMQKGTLLIDHPKPISKNDPNLQTKVSVWSEDTIAASMELQKNGRKVVALNMANAKKPGGGVEGGARAQEESIFRASNYFQSLYREENKTLDAKLGKKPYYVPASGGIYSPSVSVFRKSVKEGFAFQEPVEIDFIAAAAFDLAKENPKNYDKEMCEKIRGIFRIAANTGHDTMVLGALGCGAFKNDPGKVTTLFKQVMQEKEFKGVFKEIVFAVINDHNGKENFEVFNKEFNKFTF